MYSHSHHSTMPFRPSLGQRPNAFLVLAVVLTCSFIGHLRAQSPRAADLPELAAAWRPLEKFVFGSSIVRGNDAPSAATEPSLACAPFPNDARIVAFEENAQFLYAVGDASGVLQPAPDAGGPSKPSVFLRRVLLLKPSVFVMDDVVRPAATDGPVHWLLRGRQADMAAGGKLAATADGQEFLSETIWPAGGGLSLVPNTPRGAATVVQDEAAAPSGVAEFRWLHVFQVRPAGSQQAAAKSSVEQKDGRCEVTIAAAERTYRLSLPPPSVDAGQIAIETAEGNTLVATRPLPLGVLPHGAEGMRLIDRWDSAYRGGKRPGWDAGLVAPDLKQAVEQGVLKPCRVVDLGCGLGTNCIYLAQHGFDVTGLDISPTALSMAETKAKQAGVRVRWVLADVLALPDLEPFDLVFDRGCYHNVRYADPEGFVASLRRLCRPGTRCLILSLNRDSPPGVREETMRDDFSAGFEFEWLRQSDIRTGQDGQTRRAGWSLMLRSK